MSGSINESLVSAPSDEALSVILERVISYCPEFLPVYHFQLFVELNKLQDSELIETTIFDLKLSFSSTLSSFFGEALHLSTDWASNLTCKKISHTINMALSFLRRNIHGVYQGWMIFQKLSTNQSSHLLSLFKGVLFSYFNAFISALLSGYLQLCPARRPFVQWQTDITFCIQVLEGLLCLLDESLSSLGLLHEESQSSSEPPLSQDTSQEELKEFKGLFSLLLLFQRLSRLPADQIKSTLSSLTKAPGVPLRDLVRSTLSVRQPADGVVFKYRVEDHRFVSDSSCTPPALRETLSPLDDFIGLGLISDTFLASNEELSALSSSSPASSDDSPLSLSFQEIRTIVFRRSSPSSVSLKETLSLSDFECVLDEVMEVLDSFFEEHKFYEKYTLPSQVPKKDHTKCFLIHHLQQKEPSEYALPCSSLIPHSSMTLPVPSKVNLLASLLIVKRPEFWTENFPPLTDEQVAIREGLDTLLKELKHIGWYI